jgi:SAM-dependent methyltransferase
VDLTEASLAVARRRTEVFGLQDRIRFFQADAEQLSRVLPIEPYDLVYSFGVTHHTPRPGKVLEQIRQYLRPDGVLKVMVYHRYSWKGRFWRLDELMARYSEAQTGCPVTYTYSRGQARRLLEEHGFQVEDLQVEHIFPYRIRDYKEYRYCKEWYFRWLPKPMFRVLERRFGWHLCLTARLSGGADTSAALPAADRAASR